MAIIIIILALVSIFFTVKQVGAIKYGKDTKKVAKFKFLAVASILLAGIIMAVANPSWYALIVVIGLAVCLTADMLIIDNLAFKPPMSFIAGLGTFLLGHVAYVIAFTRGLPLAALNPLLLLPFAAIAIAVYAILWKGLDIPLKVAVPFYMAAISAMAWTALSRLIFFGNPLMLLASIGAIIFMASDSSLAIGMFRPDHWISRRLDFKRNHNAIVMGTYVVAQWLIALSILIIL